MRGGVIGYPLDQLHKEIAFVAYHFRDSVQEVMEMEHADRRGWVEQISEINRRMSEG
jgi:hypothetical protein